jgi:replicative DNA helicase
MNSRKMLFSEDSEKGLLSSLILGGDRVAVEVSVPKEAFYIPAHRIIWESLTDLIAEKRPLEFPIVKHRLEQLEMLEEVGGKEYLSDLFGFVPGWENFAHYAEYVLKYHRVRSALGAVHEMESILEDCAQASWAEVLENLEGKFRSISIDGATTTSTLRQQMDGWLDYINTLGEKLTQEGIGFGLPQLDARLGWQQPGELVIIGAATSIGKTLLLNQGLIFNSIGRRIPAALASLEMTEKQILSRWASHETLIPMNAFRSGKFNSEHSAKITGFYEKMRQVPFSLVEGLTDIEGIKSWARRKAFGDNIRLLVIDYLQLVQAGPRRYANREAVVAEIVSALKALAKELSIVVWCACQLNKEMEVRESQSIAFHSDILLKILSDGGGTLVVEKHRQGATGPPIPITIKGQTQTIEERTK